MAWNPLRRKVGHEMNEPENVVMVAKGRWRGNAFGPPSANKCCYRDTNLHTPFKCYLENDVPIEDSGEGVHGSGLKRRGIKVTRAPSGGLQKRGD